ncbi:hypothetical protein SCUP515_06639 [Seiridium cupressi]
MDASTTAFSKEIVSLGTSGLEIAAYGNGLSTTYRIPIGGSGNAASGVTVATYAGQVLTLGGSAATLADIAVVVSSTATPTIAPSSVRVGSTSGANPGGQGGGSGSETSYKNATAQTSADHSVQTASASYTHPQFESRDWHQPSGVRRCEGAMTTLDAARTLGLGYLAEAQIAAIHAKEELSP